ncbi:MAG: class A beta-lactamase-related serine hydrolase [Dehalococcoidia bacterium]|nr:class A beta-lactamase-related serine hydrolase [Dehalococcoidia bacterium]
MHAPPRGLSAAGAQAVRARFAEQLARGWHPGAQLAVFRDGALALDLAGGEAAPGRLLRVSDRMLLFSATKPLMALCIHRLHERGLLPYDAPLARWWPEFAQGGKGGVTVRHVLTHAGGFPQLAPSFDWSLVGDWEYVVAQTAALDAAWEPGAAIGYHPITYGWALGELARRIDGREPRELMHDELFAPLGVAGELSLGLDGPQLAERVPVYPCSEVTRRDPAGRERATSRITELFNGELMARAQAPAVNAYGTARALARCYAALLPGGAPANGALLAPATLAYAVAPHAETAFDRTQEVPKRYALGWYASGLAGDPFDYHDGPGVFGHAGQQSSVAYADPRYGLAVAYLTNGLQAPDIVTQRMAEMAAALRAACA